MKLQTEIPEGMNLEKSAKRILKRLEKRGCAVWDGDDGPVSYKVLDQLEQIAHNVGYRIICVLSKCKELKNAERHAGRFMIFDEGHEKLLGVLSDLGVE